MCFIEENPVERRRLVRRRLGVSLTSSNLAQIREIAEGMQYLHEHGVVHGDLKAVSYMSTVVMLILLNMS